MVGHARLSFGSILPSRGYGSFTVMSYVRVIAVESLTCGAELTCQ
jgi:hypothetical protein